MSADKMCVNQQDCPICMDVIEFNKNCVTTECGHCFHTNCLMTSIAHNGFGCPYCRTAMAEKPAAEEDDNSLWVEEEELFDDYALTSFRMFNQRINDEEVEEEPEEEEDDEEEEQEEEPTPVPNANYVADKLKQQGITYEDLVKCILLNHEEYDEHENINEEFTRVDNVVFGRFRIIISNYHPEPTVA